MKCLVMILLAFMGFSSHAQELEQMLEDQALVDDTRENEEDPQQLQQFLRKPVDLNKAGADELSLFPFLSAQQVEQFLRYRQLLGPLKHVLELQAIPSWDAATVRRIIPFVTVGNNYGWNQKLDMEMEKARQQFLLRTVAGRSPSFLLRYQIQSPNLRMGFNIEKDRGERLFQKGKGIAFVSAHASVRGQGLVRKFFMGDFLVNWGQGLLLWQGRGFRKSGATVMVKRQLPSFLEYRSNDENRYMQGVAVVLRKRALGADLFISRNLQDANIGMDSSGRRVISSLQYTGLHRTEAELEDKNALALFSSGVSLNYTKGRLKLAVNAVRHQFSIPLNKGYDPYEMYFFRGKVLSGAGFSYHYTLKNSHWFGEFTHSGGGKGLLNGVIIAMDRKLDLAILARSVSRDHNSFGSNAFMESSTVNNETGIYMGISWRPSQGIAVDAYADHFRSPWLRYRLDRPSYGHDHLFQLTWKPAKTSRMFLRWKTEKKMENGSVPVVLRQPVFYTRSSLRFQLEKTFSPVLEWRSRLEWIWRHEEDALKQSGFCFFSDLFIRSRQYPFSANLRFMLFDTDSYETRVYTYENDVMFYSSIPSYYGRGAIAYMNIRFQASDKLDLFLKYKISGKNSGQSSQTRLQLVFSW